MRMQAMSSTSIKLSIAPATAVGFTEVYIFVREAVSEGFSLFEDAIVLAVSFV
jgi:hypothetical protein